jgi:hypothetical protein
MSVPIDDKGSPAWSYFLLHEHSRVISNIKALGFFHHLTAKGKQFVST